MLSSFALILAAACGFLATQFDRTAPNIRTIAKLERRIMDVANYDNLTTVNTTAITLLHCGEYMLLNGSKQELVTQIWPGIPGRGLCHSFADDVNYTNGSVAMLAAYVRYGCACQFYQYPCDMNKGDVEMWMGWNASYWGNTILQFQGWLCVETT